MSTQGIARDIEIYKPKQVMSILNISQNYGDSCKGSHDCIPRNVSVVMEGKAGVFLERGDARG